MSAGAIAIIALLSAVCAAVTTWAVIRARNAGAAHSAEQAASEANERFTDALDDVAGQSEHDALDELQGHVRGRR